MKSARLIVVLLTLLVTACSKPLPPEKSSYAGHWQGGGIYLTISNDGNVLYKRNRGGTTTSIDAPLKAFSGDDFIVGVSFLTTTFKVSTPPHETGGVWRMVVDGVELTRVQSQLNPMNRDW